MNGNGSGRPQRPPDAQVEDVLQFCVGLGLVRDLVKTLASPQARADDPELQKLIGYLHGISKEDLEGVIDGLSSDGFLAYRLERDRNEQTKKSG